MSNIDEMVKTISEWKRPNSVNARKLITELALDERITGTDDALDALDNYGGIDRADYECQEDYSEERESAWSDFIDSLGGIEFDDDESDDKGEQIVGRTDEQQRDDARITPAYSTGVEEQNNVTTTPVAVATAKRTKRKAADMQPEDRVTITIPMYYRQRQQLDSSIGGVHPAIFFEDVIRKHVPDYLANVFLVRVHISEADTAVEKEQLASVRAALRSKNPDKLLDLAKQLQAMGMKLKT